MTEDSSRFDRPCEHLTTATGVCGASPTRLFLTGWKCLGHTPAAVAGRDEVEPDPARTLAGLREAAGAPAVMPPPPASASRVMDDRAVASGKRRSSPERFREAQSRT